MLFACSTANNLVVMDVYSHTYVQKCLVLTNQIKRHKRERTKILGQTRKDEFVVGQFHEWCGGRRRMERKF